MSENQDRENILIPCTIGIVFLMCALTFAIHLGTIALIPNDPYIDQFSIVTGAGMFFIFLSLIGGYFTSYGFLNIIRNSRRTESTTQE